MLEALLQGVGQGMSHSPSPFPLPLISGYSCIASLAKFARAKDAMPREIEHLDWTPRCEFGVVPCGAPAAWLATTRCCGASRLICNGHRVYITTGGTTLKFCPECGVRGQPRATALDWRPL